MRSWSVWMAGHRRRMGASRSSILSTGATHSCVPCSPQRPDAIAASGWRRIAAPLPIGLELVVSRRSALDGGADPANYIGGVCDVLQAERQNANPSWLGGLAGHPLYENDSQVREIHYREDSLAPTGYEVRIWQL